MGDDEGDPDWLVAFQAPRAAPVMVSSASESSHENSPTRKAPLKQQENGENNDVPDCGGSTDNATQNKGKQPTDTRRKILNASGKCEEGPSMEEKEHTSPKRSAPKKKLVMLSSDSDASPGKSPSRAGESNEAEDSLNTTRKKVGQQAKGKKSKATRTKACPNQTDGEANEKTRYSNTLEQQEEGVAEEQIHDKFAGNSVSQRLPLIIPDKVQRSKALVECDGDSIDLSGDIGAVGRIVISNGPTGNHELLLDLKGTVYKSTIVPSRTFCVVSVGQTEAKIEAIMNDFIQLEPHSNLFEAETMVEGTLHGFTFDSDGEGDRLHELHASQNDQNNGSEDPPKAKTKRKAEKPAGKVQKKAKVAGKAAKKGTRKTQTTKRTKKAKK